jgi:selenocysteine-specific elongation factor
MSTRRNIMLGTAGHVDHGKSALVKLLTGCETDTLAEEKQRGLTIDLGFAPCRLADQRVVGIVDVPGHVDFIRNMVAGAHGVDVVLFVVAADDGIMPQTLEHLHILSLMGLGHGLVALTKTDLVDAARVEAVRQDLRRLLAGTFLDEAPICPISNVSGAGFESFFDALNRTVAACGDRPCHGPFRLWVEDAFTIRGAGTVVTGIPTHGRISPGAQLHLLPGGLCGHIRRMQVYGEEATQGRAGECVALNLPDMDHDALRRGLTLVEEATIEPVTMAEAELQVLNSIHGKVEDYLEVQVHVGTASVSARLAMLENTEMTAGQRQWVQLRFAAPVPLVPGERFVVRANLPGNGIQGLTTLGGGRIIGLSNARLRRRKSWTLDLLAARRAVIGDPLRWCEQMVRESRMPAAMAGLRKSCWCRPDEMAAALERLQVEKRLVPATGGWLHTDVIRDEAQALLAAVETFHSENPHRTGISREALLAGLKMNPAVLDAALERLLGQKRLEQNGALLAKAGWNARLPDRDAQWIDRLATRLRQGGLAPPSVEDLATALEASSQRISLLIGLLAERGVVVRLDERIWMHRDAVEAAKQAALRLFRLSPGFSTMQFRDALGVSRKYAVPLVDYLDRTRFTVRSGNYRTPGVEAKRLLNRGSPAEKS